LLEVPEVREPVVVVVVEVVVALLQRLRAMPRQRRRLEQQFPRPDVGSDSND